MKKKIIALNGSARKHGNSAAMLDAFVEGIHSVDDDFESERFEKLHAQRWPEDLKRGREAGAEFAGKLL